jgi:hypothetical protein
VLGKRVGLVIGQIQRHNPLDMGRFPMNRQLALAALLILVALEACSQMTVRPGQDPFAPYSRDDSGGTRGGGEGGGGEGGSMM